MKHHKKLIIFSSAVILIILVVGVGFYFNGGKGKLTHGCSQQDRQNNNCVPKGKCAPTPEIDATLDCAPKNYDSQFCQTGNPKDCLPK